MDILASITSYVLPFLIVLTVVVFVHEWGHFIVARLNGVKVDVFSIGFGPELLGWNDRKGTRWRISAVPLGGYVKFHGDAGAASTPGQELDQMGAAERAVSFHHKRVGQRAAIVAAGPIANFILAILLFAGMFATFGRAVTPPIVGEVVAGSAADAAGFRAGDRILSVDGREVEWFSDLQRIVALRAETALTFVIDRDGRELRIEIAPRRVDVDDSFGGKRQQGQIGIRSTNEREFISYGPIAALGQGVRETVSIVDVTFTYVGRIFQGRESGKELGGPLGIAKMSGDVASVSWLALINLAAAISVSIGLINLFPVPLLDGGHLLYYAFEAVRGRPLGERAQEYGFRVGMMLVLSLFVFATWNDLVQLRVVSFLTGLFS